jgi:hypothetical protein
MAREAPLAAEKLQVGFVDEGSRWACLAWFLPGQFPRCQLAQFLVDAGRQPVYSPGISLLKCRSGCA